MTPDQVFTMVREVVILFGGISIVLFGLAAWLGGLWAKKILLHAAHALGLSKATFDRQLDLLVEYYGTFYRHYRLCQNTANADAIRAPDGAITHTKETFLEELDAFLESWHSQEGRIRLFLPNDLLPLQEEAIDAFNAFKRAVQAFRGTEETRNAKMDAFRAIHSVKERMEKRLRRFLRSDSQPGP